MLEAVSQFGFPAAGIAVGYLLEQQKILQLGRVPVQVHLMTGITGVAWDEAWNSRQHGSYGNVPVFYIGREALIANKRAAGRTKDLADAEALEGTDGSNPARSPRPYRNTKPACRSRNS
jgi:hypothetical protein